MTVRAWRVHDTGLVAVPGRFRRLAGRVRHHQGVGAAWPEQVDLAVEDGHLVAHGAVGRPAELVGRWPVADVQVRRVAPGPPVQFVLELDGGASAHLLAAPADAATDALLAALS